MPSSCWSRMGKSARTRAARSGVVVEVEGVEVEVEEGACFFCRRWERSNRRRCFCKINGACELFAFAWMAPTRCHASGCTRALARKGAEGDWAGAATFNAEQSERPAERRKKRNKKLTSLLATEAVSTPRRERCWWCRVARGFGATTAAPAPRACAEGRIVERRRTEKEKSETSLLSSKLFQAELRLECTPIRNGKKRLE